jgi:hypothetical protein
MLTVSSVTVTLSWAVVSFLATLSNDQSTPPLTVKVINMATMSPAILDNGTPLDRQRERLQALAQVGGGLACTQPIGEELARHQVILSALFQRLARTAGEMAIANKNAGAVRVNKASLSTLSAQMVVKTRQRQMRGPPPLSWTPRQHLRRC